jgi:hypothetical protein
MPFKETCSVEERIALIRDYETQAFAVSDLCRRLGSAGRRSARRLNVGAARCWRLAVRFANFRGFVVVKERQKGVVSAARDLGHGVQERT